MRLFVAKCLSDASRQSARVAVPSLKFDTFLRKHFRENEQMLVHDPHETCRAGDWLLVRRLPQAIALNVNHSLEKIVYKSGTIVDPITGKQSLGYEYVDEVRQQNQLFRLKPFHKRE